MQFSPSTPHPDDVDLLGDLPASAYDPVPDDVRARRARRPRTNRSAVLAVIALNVGFATVAELVCVRPWGWSSHAGIAMHSVLAALLLLFGVSYARAVASSPGHPDDRWTPPTAAAAVVGATLVGLTGSGGGDELLAIAVPPGQPKGAQLRIDLGLLGPESRAAYAAHDASTATITLPRAGLASVRVNAKLLRAQAVARRAFGDAARDNINFCATCEVFKPPRAHHCTPCNACVLEMDHHCIWINNCVGRDNHKLFYLVVFYAFVATSALLALYVVRWVAHALAVLRVDAAAASALFGGIGATAFRLSITEMVALGAACLCALAFIAFTGHLLIFHSFLIARGRTNVEHTCCKGAHPGCNYDRGLGVNLQHVFGSAACAGAWLLPLDPLCVDRAASAVALHYVKA
tara:strand:- start:943 stop:2157 length:1215 start_codon:yes stop_codon:yes gene_type:complete